MKLSLVIPAYNESSIIEATLRTVTARLAEMDPDYELLIEMCIRDRRTPLP